MRPTRHTSDGFAELVSEQGRGWVAAAWVVVGDAHRAEEVVQEVLVRVHRHWSRIGGLDRPGAFVRRAVINQATSVRRRDVREAAALTELGGLGGAVALDPTAEVADRDRRLWAAVRDLPQHQMQAVALRYAGDASLGEVAEALGITEPAARSVLHRARATLRGTLNPQPELHPRAEVESDIDVDPSQEVSP